MPRWFALCKGLALPACGSCRRLADRHPVEQGQSQQAWTTPEVIGQHCNRYIEQPAHSCVAIQPSEQR